VVDRALAWEGCLNVRDLGGHPTADGGTTVAGRIVRSDSVRQLSEAGWDAAVEYGIRTVLDLRFSQELDDDPPSDVPLDVVHLSLLGEPDAERWAELDRRAAAEPDAASATRFVYLEALEEHRQRFSDAVRIVAEAPSGGVLIHCMGGKDRTGLLAALLLRHAGVEIDDIAADYGLSERNLAERHDRWLAEAESDEERERLRRVLSSPADAMASVVTELERRYGDVAGYLRAGGASDEVLELARARLRD
jgi:protein-tyrosine phosphatase